jgi:hypothetical protein
MWSSFLITAATSPLVCEAFEFVASRVIVRRIGLGQGDVGREPLGEDVEAASGLTGKMGGRRARALKSYR